MKFYNYLKDTQDLHNDTINVLKAAYELYKKHNDHTLESCYTFNPDTKEPITFYIYSYLMNLLLLLQNSGYYVTEIDLLKNNLLSM